MIYDYHEVYDYNYIYITILTITTKPIHNYTGSVI